MGFPAVYAQHPFLAGPHARDMLPVKFGEPSTAYAFRAHHPPRHAHVLPPLAAPPWPAQHAHTHWAPLRTASTSVNAPRTARSDRAMLPKAGAHAHHINLHPAPPCAASPPPVHVVCTAPLVAPKPLPYHSPTFLQFDLPDDDEDLSHPPYVSRPHKRKRAPSPSSSADSDDNADDDDAGPRRVVMRRRAADDRGRGSRWHPHAGASSSGGGGLAPGAPQPVVAAYTYPMPPPLVVPAFR